MARAIWKGSLNFGLVEIPVGLFPADQPRELDLTLLDRRDFSPVGYKRYNKRTNRELQWSEIVRGYEHEKGEYVVLTEAELKAANPAVTQTVQIQHFVDADEIEPIFYEKPYYLAPLSKQGKGYVLLRETLKRTATVGIARIAVHTREHVAAVGVRGDALVLYLLRFAAEIRPAAEVPGVSTSAKLQPREVAMAAQLVESMKEPWRPERLRDEYSRDVLALVSRKVKSGDIHALPAEDGAAERKPRGGKIIDLMPLLQQSIAASRRTERSPRAKAGVSARGRPAARRGATRARAVRTRRRAAVGA